LPFFWDPGFCWKWPISLGYTRGHFSALVPMDPDCDPMTRLASASRLDANDINGRSTYLPLTSIDGSLLPVHFLTESDVSAEFSMETQPYLVMFPMFKVQIVSCTVLNLIFDIIFSTADWKRRDDFESVVGCVLHKCRLYDSPSKNSQATVACCADGRRMVEPLSSHTVKFLEISPIHLIILLKAI